MRIALNGYSTTFWSIRAHSACICVHPLMCASTHIRTHPCASMYIRAHLFCAHPACIRMHLTLMHCNACTCICTHAMCKWMRKGCNSCKCSKSHECIGLKMQLECTRRRLTMNAAHTECRANVCVCKLQKCNTCECTQMQS